jgi:hypothetical protein
VTVSSSEQSRFGDCQQFRTVPIWWLSAVQISHDLVTVSSSEQSRFGDCQQFRTATIWWPSAVYNSNDLVTVSSSEQSRFGDCQQFRTVTIWWLSAVQNSHDLLKVANKLWPYFPDLWKDWVKVCTGDLHEMPLTKIESIVTTGTVKGPNCTNCINLSIFSSRSIPVGNVR